MLFNAKTILVEQWWYYLIHSWEDKEVYTFYKCISTLINAIARLEFEVTPLDVEAQNFNHYVTINLASFSSISAMVNRH